MFKDNRLSLFYKKWTHGLAWNYGSLFLMAISGAFINFIILTNFDAAYLGLFNIGFACYIILGQLGTGGIQHGLLHYIAQHEKSPLLVSTIIRHGIFLVLINGSVLALLWIVLSTPLAYLIKKPQLIPAFHALTPALALFVINKALLMSCNGLKRMKVVAVGTASRYFCLMLGIMVCSGFSASIEQTFLCFFTAEIAVSVIFCMALRDHLFHFAPLNKEQCKKMIVFGLKALPVGTLIELNTRIDVLILSYFVSANEVGLYSFVAMIAEGLMLLLVVIRNQVNPYLAETIAINNWLLLSQLITSLRRYLYSGALVFVILLNLCYLPIVEWLLPGQGLSSTLPLLMILSFSFLLIAGFLPFDQMLNMGGAPGYQSLQSIAVVMSNILLNFMLIPFWGILGAAIATAIANSIVAIFSLRWLVRKAFNFQAL